MRRATRFVTGDGEVFSSWNAAQEHVARVWRETGIALCLEECPGERKPPYGSQEWAETYSDDLGESPDY